MKALLSKNPSYQIWVTGHSLGAALAPLASAWLAYYNIAPRQNVILYTFGSPRVGDYKYALQHDQLVNNSWRVVNFDDVVPHLPPLSILHTENVTEHRTTRTNHAVAAYSLS